MLLAKGFTITDGLDALAEQLEEKINCDSFLINSASKTGQHGQSVDSIFTQRCLKMSYGRHIDRLGGLTAYQL